MSRLSRWIPALWAALAAAALLLIPRPILDPNWIPGYPEDMYQVPADTIFFAYGGEYFFKGGLGLMYQMEELLAGPLQCIADWAILWVFVMPFGKNYLLLNALLTVTWCLALAYGIVWATRRLRPVVERGAPWAKAGWMVPAGLAYAVFLALPMTLNIWGHWWQVPTMLTWIAGVVLISREDARMRTGVLVGLLLAVGFLLEPWAVLAWPLLLLARRWKPALVAGAVAAGISLPVLYVQLTSGVGSVAWRVFPGSLWNLVVADGQMTTLHRAVQALLVLALVSVAVLVVRFRRVNPLLVAMWLPLVVFGCRIGFETIWFPYYLTAAEMLLIVWGFSLLALRRWAAGAICVATLVLTHAQGALFPPFYNGFVLVVAATAALLLSVPRERAPSQIQEGTDESEDAAVEETVDGAADERVHEPAGHTSLTSAQVQQALEKSRREKPGEPDGNE